MRYTAIPVVACILMASFASIQTVKAEIVNTLPSRVHGERLYSPAQRYAQGTQPANCRDARFPSDREMCLNICNGVYGKDWVQYCTAFCSRPPCK